MESALNSKTVAIVLVLAATLSGIGLMSSVSVLAQEPIVTSSPLPPVVVNAGGDDDGVDAVQVAANSAMAILGVVSAALGIILAILGIFKNNETVKKWIKGIEGLRGTDEEIAKHKAEFATAISVLVNTVPAFKENLQKYAPQILRAGEDSDRLKGELERLYPVIGAIPTAERIEDMATRIKQGGSTVVVASPPSPSPSPPANTTTPNPTPAAAAAAAEDQEVKEKEKRE